MDWRLAVNTPNFGKLLIFIAYVMYDFEVCDSGALNKRSILNIKDHYVEIVSVTSTV